MFNEQHLSVKQLAKLWGFSEFTIRELFSKEGGVIRIVRPENTRTGKRGYTSMRIPDSVARRVHERMSRQSKAA